MFDIGFWELVLVFVIALVVLGPERLPGAARQVGQWVRRIRGLAYVAQQELERELKISELRQQLKENPEAQQLRALRSELQSLDAFSARSIQPPASAATPLEAAVEAGAPSPPKTQDPPP